MNTLSRGILAGMTGLLLISSSGLGLAGEGVRKELRKDRREISQDRLKIAKERKDIRDNLKDLKANPDNAAGDKLNIKQDAKDIRNLRKELREDRQDLAQDRKDLRQKIQSNPMLAGKQCPRMKSRFGTAGKLQKFSKPQKFTAANRK